MILAYWNLLLKSSTKFLFQVYFSTPELLFFFNYISLSIFSIQWDIGHILLFSNLDPVSFSSFNIFKIVD